MARPGLRFNMFELLKSIENAQWRKVTFEEETNTRVISTQLGFEIGFLE